MEARRARDAGEPYSGAALGMKFGKSGRWGRLRLAEIQDEGGVDIHALSEQVRAQARVEARRARDAGEPYDGVTLAKKFGRGPSWGRQRLAEIRNQHDLSDASRQVSGQGEQDALLALLQLNRGDQSSGTGAAAGAVVPGLPSGPATVSAAPDARTAATGMTVPEAVLGGPGRVAAESAGGAAERAGLAAVSVDFVGEGGGRKRRRVDDSGDEGAARRPVDEAVREERSEEHAVPEEQLWEQAREEARRARDAGEPYTGVELGKKFGKSEGWGRSRLAEIRNEPGASREELDEQERERARVEARRARDAGEPYTGVALAKKFGKSQTWGAARLGDIRSEDGVNLAARQQETCEASGRSRG